MGPTHLRQIRPTKQTNRTTVPTIRLFLTSKFSTSNIDIFPSTYISFLLYRIPLHSFSFPLAKEKDIPSSTRLHTLHRLSPVTFTPRLATNPNFQTPPFSRNIGQVHSTLPSSTGHLSHLSLYKTQISISVAFFRVWVRVWVFFSATSMEASSASANSNRSSRFRYCTCGLFRRCCRCFCCFYSYP